MREEGMRGVQNRWLRDRRSDLERIADDLEPILRILSDVRDEVREDNAPEVADWPLALSNIVNDLEDAIETLREKAGVVMDDEEGRGYRF
jgi:hypothetical protein